MNNRSKLHSFFSSLLDIIEEIAALFIALILIIVDRRVPGSVKEIDLILAILGIVILIAVSNLRDKLSRLRKIKAKIDYIYFKLEQKVFDPIRAENFFSSNIGFSTDEISQSKDVLFSGITLVRTIGKYHETIHDSVVKGARVRILILDESLEDSINQLTKRSWGKVPEDYYQRRILSTYEQVRVIAENIKGSPEYKGSLEIGKVPFVPSFGLIAINPKNNLRGKMNVEIYHHLTDNRNPDFWLQSSRDSYWFYFFIEQFEMMWKNSSIVKLV